MTHEKQERIQGQGGANLTALVIDRKRWHRGDSQTSALLAKDGRMCCLGLLGEACRIPDYALDGNGEPDQVSDYLHMWPEWVMRPVNPPPYADYEQTATVGALIAVNDNPDLPEPAREAEVARIFAEHGVTVTFTDGTP